MRQFFRDTQGRIYPNLWDVVALMLVLALIVLFAWSGLQMTAPYSVGEPIHIHLGGQYLPAYALRTVSRMLIALLCSLVFTFIFGTWAAKSRFAERVIVPLIDILQSVPILGFLSITIVGFIALFPGSLLGAECAAIFAIFTSQAWNMALGFYQSMRTIPSDMVEAADMLQLSSWQRFWRVEVPFSMPSLLWNTMLSMSASWFFVVASEAITVSRQDILLPGIGSYIATAIMQADGLHVFYSVITMLMVILFYDQIIFRPLVVWGEKFKAEYVSQEHYASSWLVTLFQRTRLFYLLQEPLSRFSDAWINFPLFLRKKSRYSQETLYPTFHAVLNWTWNILLLLAVILSFYALGHFIFASVSVHEAFHVLLLGLVTAVRVIVLIIISSIIWVPIGVWIGLRPKAAQFAQPIVQFLAAFPANLLFPVVVVAIVTFHLNVEVWVTPLMILGAQWYILFNVIAGASALPKDLQQVADNFGLKRSLRWRRLILPGIFPFYVTGAITAVGGAWNASIVAEVVSWGNTTLVATGLGAYIKDYTTQGDFPRIALGIGVMCVYVLLLNRVLWRPLSVFGEKRFKLD